jgi:hypothetical protein
MSVLGLPADDPLALVPLADMGRTDVASQMQMPGQMFGPLPGPTASGAQGVATPVPAQGMPPWMQQPPQQNCAVFCLGNNPPAAVQPQLPPEALPPGVVAPQAGPPGLAPGTAAELAPPPPAEAPPAQAPIGPQGVGPAPGPAA